VNYRKIGFLSLLGLALAAALYISHPLYLAWVGRSLIASDMPAPSDAILVLSGDNLRDERLLHAVGLWRSGLAPRIVLSATLADWQTTEDYAPWRHAMKLKIPSSAVVLAPHQADSTREEAGFLRSYLPEHGYASVILVTSNYHTRRAKKVFEKEWRGSPLRFRVSGAPDYQFHPDGWWTHRVDSRTFFYEFSKTIWYAIAE
jgi:uncharacterized SAM-binding protein YcdF (DUF218 family)